MKNHASETKKNTKEKGKRKKTGYFLPFECYLGTKGLDTPTRGQDALVSGLKESHLTNRNYINKLTILLLVFVPTRRPHIAPEWMDQAWPHDR